jgi:hypothetical protein
MNIKSNKIEKDLQRKKEFAAKVFKDRLRILKKGQEFSVAGDIAKAVESYSQYLNAVAGFHGIDETKLSPKLFDKEKDISELFLVSHVYWDLAKAYDRSPRLHNESIRCLNQYVLFTLGFKYQYVNARTLKNFIRKRLAHNPAAFKDAYDKIQVESKGCFISSDLHGQYSPVTQRLRHLKSMATRYKFGIQAIAFYYEIACPLYFKSAKYVVFRALVRPLLYTLTFLISLFFISDVSRHAKY